MGRTPQRTTSTNGQQHRPHPRRLSFSAAEPKQQATVVAAIPPRTTEALAPAQEEPIKEEVVQEVDLGKVEVDPAVREAQHAEGSRKSESEHAAQGEVDEAESLRQQGNAEYQAGRYDAAIELYSRSILANPRRSLSFSNRAAARLRTNDVQAAYQDALAALRLDPTNAKAHAHAGRCRFLMCNFGESQKSFEAGLALDPSDPAGLNAKGAHDCRRASGLLAECRRLVAERAHERALEQLDVLVREYPDLAPRPSVARTRAEIFEHLGLRLHDEGKFAEAAAALTSAIDLVENGVSNHRPGRSVCVEATSASQKEKEKSSNGLPALLANRASARKRLGDLPGALSDCLRCLALEPALLAARARLAHILVDLQEYDEALRLLDEAPPATSAAKFSDLDAAREQLGAERQYVNRTRADAQLRFFGGKDHARMLGLQLSPNGFPEAEVRQAFKRQALLWHPDKAPDAAAKELCAKVFRSVQASYQRLLDGWRPSPAAFPSSAQATTAGTAAFRSRSTNSAAPGKPFAFGSSEYRRADAARAAASTYPQPTMFV